MPHEARKFLDCDRLLICEGPTDEAFLRALIKQRQLPNYCLRIPEDASNHAGVDGFPNLLEAIPSWDGSAKLRHVVIVSDNDQNAAESFGKVRDFLRAVKPDIDPPFVYGVPSRAWVRAAGTPATTALVMLPSRGNRGCLETLLLEAAFDASGDARAAVGCIDQYARCTRAHRWPASRKAKMRLTCLIAGTNQKYPSLPLTQVWTHNPELIPLDHAAFDEIAHFLGRA